MSRCCGSSRSFHKPSRPPRTVSPADTKTVVESGVHVYWGSGDEIAEIMGEKAAKFTSNITAASGTAKFKGTFGEEGWPEEQNLWAVYPFSEDAVFEGLKVTPTDDGIYNRMQSEDAFHFNNLPFFIR